MQSIDIAGNGFDHAFGDNSIKILDIELDPPIEWNGKSYNSLHLEEPTGQMVERAESELGAAMNVHTMRKYSFALVSHAAGVPRQVVERMRISQIVQAMDFLSAFIASGRATGAN